MGTNQPGGPKESSQLDEHTGTSQLDEQLIRETLNDYIQGGSGGDIARLRSAFLPGARVRSVRDGALVDWSLDQYLDVVAAATRQERVPEILDIRWDGNIGSAHLRLTYKDFRFVDRFNLMKLNGKWLIVDKMFLREPIFLPGQ